MSRTVTCWILASFLEVVHLAYLCQNTPLTVISSKAPLKSSIQTANLLQCMKMCKYVPNCESVTYDVAQRLCAFNCGVTENKTAVVFEKYKRVCEQQVEAPGPCDNNPCRGTSSQCLPLGNSYKCLDMLQCPKPLPPENGDVSFDGTSVLSAREFTCSEGYNMDGKSQSKCQPDGQWDAPDPVCQIVECGTPAAKASSSVQYTSTTYGSVATYTCEKLYMSFGGDRTETATCLVDGTWDELPDCAYTDVVAVDDWILMFRVTADINIFSYDTWADTTTYHDHPADRDDVKPGCRSLNGSLLCDIHFRSKLLDEWETLTISEVKVAVLNKGQMMAEIVFDGRGSDKENWFQRSKVTSSTWTDLKTTNINIFSVQGWRTRRFYINYYLGSCPADKGWLVVLDKEPVCSSYKFQTGPKIMYSPPPEKSYIASDYLQADVMAVLVKLD